MVCPYISDSVPAVSSSDTWQHGRGAETVFLLRSHLEAAVAVAALLVAVEGVEELRVVVVVQQDTNAMLIDLHGLPSGPHHLTSRPPLP